MRGSIDCNEPAFRRVDDGDDDDDALLDKLPLALDMAAQGASNAGHAVLLSLWEDDGRGDEKGH